MLTNKQDPDQLQYCRLTEYAFLIQFVEIDITLEISFKRNLIHTKLINKNLKLL